MAVAETCESVVGYQAMHVTCPFLKLLNKIEKKVKINCVIKLAKTRWQIQGGAKVGHGPLSLACHQKS